MKERTLGGTKNSKLKKNKIEQANKHLNEDDMYM